MANIKSAQKRARQNIKRRAHNRTLRTRTRTFVKRARIEVASSDPQEAQSAVLEAVRELDKAASKGVIHPNKASRLKSRLMKKLNAQ